MKKWLLRATLALMLTLPVFAYSAPRVSAVNVLEPVCQDENGRPLQGDKRPKVCDQDQSESTDSPITGENGVLNRATQILFFVVGVASVVVIAISGLRFIVSAGDSNAISSARRSMLYAIIGLMVAVIARIIVRFVLSRLNNV